MLINIIQNTIGGLISAGFSIVREGLKMFLPLRYSQQLGEELVVNGDFATDSDWTKEAGWTISGGKANFSGGSGNRNMSQAIGITNGKTYEIKYTVSSISAGAVSVRLGGMSGISEVTATTTGVFSGFITANSSANGNVQIEDNDNNFVGSIDNVSVKEVGQFSLDETTNNNDAKLLTGNCLDFDGTNDYLDIGTNNVESSYFTVAAWIYKHDNSQATIFNTAETSSPYEGTDCYISSTGQIGIFANNGFRYSSTIIQLNQWNRIVWKFYKNSSSGTVEASLNGGTFFSIYSGNTGSSNLLVNDGRIQIGRYQAGSNYFNGYISDVQLYNIAWTQADVANDYAKPNEVVSSVPTANLVGYWAMTEGNGGLAYDSSSLLSAEKVSNGTFELGSEEVTNGDFATDSDWSEGTGWDIDVVNNKATCDGTQTGRSSLFQTGVLQQGIQYQFEFTLKDVTSGNIRLRNGIGASEIYISDKSLNDTYIVVTEVIASNQTLVVDADENFEGSVTNISVKEVFPDWIIGNADATHFVESASGGGARYVSGTTSPVLYLRQNCLTSGKTFQVSCNVAYTGSGLVRCSVGGVNQSPFEEGANTLIATAGSAIFEFVRHSTNVDAVITNLSIKQVTPADNGAITNGATWLPAQSTIPQLGMMDWSKGSNLIPYSEDFENSDWSKVKAGTGLLPVVSSNSTISPDGTKNASQIVFDAGTGTTSGDSSQILDAITFTNNTVGTASIYLKGENGGEKLVFRGVAFSTYTIVTLTTEWQRFSTTENSGTNTDAITFGIRQNVSGLGIINSSATVYAWGAQIEESSSAGNYRKTNGTAVTNAILPPYPVNPTTDVLGNLLRQRLNSLNLTGTGVAEVADSASINPSAITVQCWIFSNTENAKGLVAKWGNGLLDYMLFKTTNNFRFYIGSSFKTSGTIPNTGWVNIAGTYDGSNITTFINGALSTTSSTSISIPNNTNVLEIGRYGSNSTHSYSERIDDVKLYDRALTADEILQNYKAGLSAHTN